MQKNKLKTFLVFLLALSFSISIYSCKKKADKPVVGQTYEGGVVFYIDGTGSHGLVAAAADANTGSAWGCKGSIVSGADGTAIGTGKQNTADIVSSCSEAGNAAKVCDDYVSGGFSDWYLPSRDELSLMFQSKDKIGGFSADQYWSSSETNAVSAWLQDFSTGVQFSTTYKDYGTRVRAIRSF